MANELFAKYAASVLEHVAHNIESYLPDEYMLEGSELVVRVPDVTKSPTVEISGSMLVQGVERTARGSVTSAKRVAQEMSAAIGHLPCP